jgi:TonB family protein
MRLWIGIALLTFSAAMPVIVPPVLAQDDQASKRKLVTRVVPSYPDLARRLYLRGKVKVEVIVTPGGSVKSTHVIGGSPLLTRAAVDAIEKWKWAQAPEESKELIELTFHPE